MNTRDLFNRDVRNDALFQLVMCVLAMLIIVACLVWLGVSADRAGASTKPACPRNATIIGHNRPLRCELSPGGILIELGTSRLECADAGGRFVVVTDRRLCVGEDI